MRARGWLFYDAGCGFCRWLVRRLAHGLRRAGYRAAPLQAPGVAHLFALPPARLYDQARLATADGRRLGGGDAVAALGRHVRVLRPAWMAARVPLGLHLLRAGYAWVSARRDRFARAVAPPPRPVPALRASSFVQGDPPRLRRHRPRG